MSIISSSPGLVFKVSAGTNVTVTGTPANPIINASGGGGGGGDWVKLVQVVFGTSISPITGTGGIVATFTAAGLVLSSIQQSFSKLVIDITGRSAAVVTSDDVKMQFNGDTGANYNFIFAEAVTSSVIAGTTLSTSQGSILNIPGSTAATNLAASGSIEIRDYAGSVFFKQSESRTGLAILATPAPAWIAFSHYWANTAAITAINLFLASAGNFVNGTTITVYGVN